MEDKLKLIIQIPCYNEEDTLPITLKELPRKVADFDAVEWLLINDGSTDSSVTVAQNNGIDHIVNFNNNKGLAEAFVAGLEKCIELGADVIVNIDADNQYNAKDIPKLVKPILDGKADIVVGERPIEKIEHFTILKKALQKLGSMIVRIVSDTDVADAPSGFRAISRDAALRLNVFSTYTYTLETIIQAGRKNLSIVSVPIRVNKDLRPSRLVKNIISYIRRSVETIIRIFVVYRPFYCFMIVGLILFTSGFALGVRFLYFFFTDGGEGHIQSLVLTAIFIGIGFQTMLVAFLADLISVNRKVLEDVQTKLRIAEAGKKNS